MEIHSQKKEGAYGILSLYLDGSPWRDVHESIFGKKPKVPASCSTKEELEEQFQRIELSLAKQYVLKRLAMKSFFTGELISKLTECLISPQTISMIIRECKHLGYLNDETWLEGFINTCKARKLGPRAIAMKMKSKGVSQDLITHWIEKCVNPDEQQEAILKLLATRYRNRDLSNYKEKSKVIAALLRKGYEFSTIQKVLEAYHPEDQCIW